MMLLQLGEEPIRRDPLTTSFADLTTSTVLSAAWHETIVNALILTWSVEPAAGVADRVLMRITTASQADEDVLVACKTYLGNPNPSTSATLQEVLAKRTLRRYGPNLA